MFSPFQGSSVVMSDWECHRGRKQEQVPGRTPTSHGAGKGVLAAVILGDNMINDRDNAHTCKGWFCRLDNLLLCCILVYSP